MSIRDYIDIIEKSLSKLLEFDPILVPAIKHLPTGRIFRGKSGEYHHDVAEVNGFFGVNWRDNPELVTGFVNHKGQFLTRERALDYAIENDLLHDMAKEYMSGEDVPAELGASFLKKR